jgi:hypothetical protein
MVVDELDREEAQNVLDPELQQQLLEYQGRWVAITRTELLGAGDAPEEALRLAAERGVAAPILYFVPRDGDSRMFFI